MYGTVVFGFCSSFGPCSGLSVGGELGSPTMAQLETIGGGLEAGYANPRMRLRCVKSVGVGARIFQRSRWFCSKMQTKMIQEQGV